MVIEQVNEMNPPKGTFMSRDCASGAVTVGSGTNWQDDAHLGEAPNAKEEVVTQSIDTPVGDIAFDDYRRRTFASSKMLKLGDDLLRDEARRLRDLLAFHLVPLLADGRRLPTEDEIAREFRASRNSVRAALQLLASERAIRRVVGMGTYVDGEPRSWHPDRLSDSRATYPQLGSEIVVLGWRVEYDIPRTLASSYSPDATRLAIFEKRHSIGGLPALLRTFFVPLRPQDSLGPDDAPDDLLGILEGRFGHNPLHADRIITAIAADKSTATQLEVASGSPLLHVQTAVYAPDGSLVLLYFIRQRSEVVQLSVAPERIF